MPKRTLFLHVGPPKTATTFLQDEVLARLRTPKIFVKPTVEIGEVTVPFGDLFCFSPEIWREAQESVFEAYVDDREAGRDVIISSELIYGGFASPQPWFGRSDESYGPVVRTDRQTDGRPDFTSLSAHLQTLSDVASGWGFSDVKVLATTRRQDTKLASGYAQMSDKIFGASQEHFERWLRHLINDPLGRCAGGGIKLDYYLWWKKVSSALGAENVFLISFERLKQDQTAFLRRWLGFLEVPDVDRVVDSLAQAGDVEKNVKSSSPDVWSLGALKMRPTLRPRRLFQAMGLPSYLPIWVPDVSRDREIQLSPELRTEILDVYRDNNSLLDESSSHLNLKEYGYY